MDFPSAVIRMKGERPQILCLLVGGLLLSYGKSYELGYTWPSFLENICHISNTSYATKDSYFIQNVFQFCLVSILFYKELLPWCGFSDGFRGIEGRIH